MKRFPHQHFGQSAVQIIGIVITVGLILFYGVLFFQGRSETADAERIDLVQVKLQAALSEGVTTLQLPALEIKPANVLHAAESEFPKGVKMDESLTLYFPDSIRKARFTVSEAGDIELASLNNFTRYHVENGRIRRNTHWFKQNTR